MNENTGILLLIVEGTAPLALVWEADIIVCDGIATKHRWGSPGEAVSDVDALAKKHGLTIRRWPAAIE